MASSRIGVLLLNQSTRCFISQRYSFFSFPSKSYFSSMAEPQVKAIDFESLKQKVLNKKVTLIDVREPKELKEDGKIPNSVNIPLGQIGDAFKLSESEFKEKYGIDKPAESDGLVLSCRSGKRATTAYDKVLHQGYMNIMVYLGSFNDWQEKGGPIEK